MKLYTITQYAKKKKVSRVWIWKQIKAKKLKAKLQGHQYLISAK